MEANKISRLREEQQKAVSETEDTMEQLERYKADYKALQKRLETLPDKVTHDVMVPFGKLAFMPGELVHTNEIMVLLGDNWFAEQSAKQAHGIAARRIKELEKRLTEIEEQKRLLEPRLGITSELHAVAEGKGDYKDIIEDYSEEKERLWDEQHKIFVRRHNENRRKIRNSSDNNDVKLAKSATSVSRHSDEDLWSRLDALEKQEIERGELNSSFESDSNTEDVSGQGEESDCQRKRNLSLARDKRVIWMDEKDKNNEVCNEYHGDDNDTDSDYEVKPIIKTITFQHTKAPTLLPPEGNQEFATPHDSAHSNITSPAEIYKLFSPKPILKKMPETRTSDMTMKLPNNTRDCCFLPSCEQSNDVIAKPMSTLRDKAFTGIVKENPSTRAPSQPTATTNTSIAQEEPKRMSKFRAQRKGQKHEVDLSR